MKNYRLKYGSMVILLMLLLSDTTTSAQSNPAGKEPKSTHTWLGTDKTNIYSYDIDIRVVNFPTVVQAGWLYYFSLQVNFTGHDEWAHGGIQLANVEEFKYSNMKGVNWGGGSDWAGYGGIGRTNTPFIWELGKWYRYRVWRLSQDAQGLWQWGFWVMDYTTGVNTQYGTVRTKSEYISTAVVWIETGYGVQCTSGRASVEWRNPVFQCATPGQFLPNTGTADYNGTCDGANSTNQGLISTNPLTWFQTTNAPRTVSLGQRLW